MLEQLESKLARFEEIERLLVDPQVLADPQQLAALARERGSLARVVSKYREFKQLNQQIAQARELIEHGDDEELRELAEAELPQLREKREKLYDELIELTLGGQDADRSRCLMEIRAGTGGEEAALFARDLFHMYRKYAESKGWKVEVMDASPTELGGFKQIVFAIEGQDCYRLLRYEGGVHRVQRVPETEAKGRIHTSAATVAVMPEPEEVEVELRREDYREDVFHASGPGGQHVNKTASAIRLTHLETGIVVVCQDERSQHKNRAKALRMLKAKLYEHKQREEMQKRADQRRAMIGSGDRSERIRTYNFPENRVTDHRIGLTLYQLDRIIQGQLDPVIQALLDYQREQHKALLTQGSQET